MKDLCVVAVVDEGYQEYVPLYLYFLSRAYPQYEARIYFRGRFHPQVAEAIDSLRDTTRFEILPIPYDFDESNPQALKSLRWVLYDEAFLDFEHVYIGDIDMFLVPEETPLHKAHAEHCRELSLPYSNRIRGGQRKLTGLHFVRTREYFDAVLPTIERYRATALQGTLAISNEELLYNMIEESVGLPPFVGNFVTHHGMHARAFDRYRSLEEQRARTDFVFHRHFEPYAPAFRRATETLEFESLRGRLSRIEYEADLLARYPDAGPRALAQVDVLLALCRDLDAEGSSQDRKSST